MVLNDTEWYSMVISGIPLALFVRENTQRYGICNLFWLILLSNMYSFYNYLVHSFSYVMCYNYIFDNLYTM